MTTPISLASLMLIKHAFHSFNHADLSLSDMISVLATNLCDIRNLYETECMQNKVVDGTEPFPENQQSLRSGISVEFRLVSYIRFFIQAFLIYNHQECFVPVF
jgi:hypothetical protein